MRAGGKSLPAGQFSPIGFCRPAGMLLISRASRRPPMAPRPRPPFRADHVGSLLRPSGCRRRGRSTRRAAFPLRSCGRSRISVSQTPSAGRKRSGCRAATDGEYRRAYWHYDFVSGLDGVEIYEPEQKIAFKGGGAAARAEGDRADPLQPSGDGGPFPLPGEPCADGDAEEDDPLAAVVHFRGGRNVITAAVYPGWRRSSPIWAWRIVRRCARLPMRAADICSWTKCTSRISVIRSRRRG